MNTEKKIPFEKTPIGNAVFEVIGWVLFLIFVFSAIGAEATKKIFHFFFP